MDDRIARLKTPEECRTFERNAQAKGREDLVLDARRKGIELRAAQYGAVSDAERDCLQAIYAYEEILNAKHGKRVRASRIWQMIKRRGIIAAIEQAVDRPDGTAGFTDLKEVGLDNFAFEAVVLRHRTVFSPAAVNRARERMQGFSATVANPE